MTATAMILGMLPMSLGLGEGGEQNAPLGRAVIGGLMLATVTTLFVVPIVYTYLRAKPPVDHERRLEQMNRRQRAGMISDPQSAPRSGRSSEAERLRRENEELKRQLAELKEPGETDRVRDCRPMWRPSGVTISALFLIACVLVVVAFFAGYVPLQKRNALIVAEAQEAGALAAARRSQRKSLRSRGNSELPLPGNIQAITEAPVLARADGYIVRRMADIGDRVRAGQPLAEIEAPEMDEQIRQAKAALQQAQAGVNQALSNLKRGQADTELARITAQRYASLAAQGRGLPTGQRPLSFRARVAARRHCSRFRTRSPCSGATWRPPRRASRVSKGSRAIRWSKRRSTA